MKGNTIKQTTPVSDYIKHCPFCGSFTIRADDDHLECMDCGARGPQAHGETNMLGYIAAKKWNERSYSLDEFIKGMRDMSDDLRREVDRHRTRGSYKKNGGTE